MLRFFVEYKNFVKDIKQILGFRVSKVKGYFLGLLKREKYAYTFIKVNFVFFGKKIEKMVYLTGWKNKKDISNMVKIT